MALIAEDLQPLVQHDVALPWTLRFAQQLRLVKSALVGGIEPLVLLVQLSDDMVITAEMANNTAINKTRVRDLIILASIDY